MSPFRSNPRNGWRKNKYLHFLLTFSLLGAITVAFASNANADLVTAKPFIANTVDSNTCDQNSTPSNGVIAKKIGNECVIQFTAVGAFTWSVPAGITKINRLLVVGGGGAGGARTGAGGGAGGLIEKKDVDVSTVTSASITVGAGGGETSYTGGNGGDSVITIGASTTIAKGGGGGGAGSSTRSGSVGGSGGGSMGIGNSWGTPLVAGTAGLTGQGKIGATDSNLIGNGGAGGTGYGPLASSQPAFESTHPKYGSGVYPQWLGGGGGGAGGNGGNASVVESGTSLDASIFTSGKGGLGYVSDITGTKICYAAGGGGGGSQRATGVANTYVLTNQGAPPASWGIEGDVYIDQNVNYQKIYVKSGGIWSITNTFPFTSSGVPGGCADTSTASTGGNGGIGLWKGGWGVPNTGSGGGGGGWLAANSAIPTHGQGAVGDWTANSGAGGSGTVVIRYTIADSSLIPASTTGLAILDYNPSTPPSGSTWADGSGSNNTGTLVNAPTFTPDSGTTRGYLTFNGTNQAITTRNQMAYPGPQTYSIAVWFKTDALGAEKIIGYENTQAVLGGTYYDRLLYVGTDHKLYWGLCDTSYTSYCPRTVHTLSTVNDNQWHFAVATQSTVNGVASIALSIDNGAPYVSSTGAQAQLYAGWWKIGAYTMANWPSVGNYNGYFKGSLGRITIYNTALNSSQATQLFNKSYSPTSVTATPDTQASGKINLVWPSAAGATGYVIKVYSGNGASLLNTVNVDSATTKTSISSLTPGTGYRFSITATNATGSYYFSESAKTPMVVAPNGACAPTRLVSGGYTILRFDALNSQNGSNTCLFTMDTITTAAEYLVVGGGGGGGTNGGYGGQGGYYTAGTFDSATISGKPLSISVGAGGAGGQKIDPNAFSTVRNGIDGQDSALTLGSSSYVASGGAGGLTIWEHWGCYTSNFLYAKQGFPLLGTSVPGKQGFAGGGGGRASTGAYVSGGAGYQGYLDKAQVFNQNAVFSSGGGGGGWGGGTVGGVGSTNSGAGGGPNAPGAPATWYGSGGGAGGDNCSAGGSGYRGVVYIRYLNPLPKAPAASLTLPVSGAYQQFTANNFNALSKVWKDSSGNNRDGVVVGGSPYIAVNTAGTVNSRNDFYTVSGTNTDAISFGKLPTVNTIFHVARYSGAIKGRIFDSTYEGPGWNWLTGFWNGLIGVAYHNVWNTQSTNSVSPQTDWLITTDQHGADDENMVRFNGVDRTTYPIGYNPTGNWGINLPTYYNEQSDYSVAEVIVYDRALSIDEIKQVESYLNNKYVYQSAQIVGYLGGGGWQPDQYCPSGKVGVGLTFNAIADYGMSQFKMRCAVVSASGLSVDTSTADWAVSSPKATIGVDTRGEAKVANCPVNNVLTGLHMVQGASPASAWGNKWPVGVKLQCAPIDQIDTRTLVATAYYPSTGYRVAYAQSPTTNLSPVDDNAIDSGCPAGQLATGFVAKTGGITDNLGLLCGYPSLGQPTITSAGATPSTLKSLDVNWGRVNNAASYGVTIYDTATSPNLLASYAVTDTSTTINATNFSTIQNGTQYVIRITAQGNGYTYANSLDSDSWTVKTLDAPGSVTFTSQPSLSTSPGDTSKNKVRQGTSVTIVETATVGDGGTRAWQWQKLVRGNWQNLVGETNQNLTIASVTETSTASYRVAVTNTKSGATSDPFFSDSFTLTVVGIVTPTAGLVARAFDSYTVTLRTFGGSGTFALGGGVNLATAGLTFDSTTTTATISGASPSDSATVTVLFTSGGITDTTSVFTIRFVGTRLGAPTGVSASATPDKLKSINVSWTNVDTPTTNQIILRDDTGTVLVTTGLDSLTAVSGLQSATITSANYPDLADSTNYKVSVMALDNTDTYADSLESDSKTVITNGPVHEANSVAIDVKPGAGTLNSIIGDNVTFIVTATPGGVGTPTYQWQKKGIDIPGAVYDSLTVTNLNTGDAGDYNVEVTYSFAGETSTATTSNVLTLKVVASVQIAQPTNGLVGIVGQPFSLKLNTSSGTPNYIWSTSSTLPAGLNFYDTGTISGIPTSIGITPLIVKVKDANNTYDTSTAFSISVVLTRLDSTTITAAPTPKKLKSFDLTWPAVTNADRYRVTLYDETGTAVLATVDGISGTSYTLNSNDFLDMEDWTTYKFTVVAEDAAGAYGDSVESKMFAARSSRAPSAPVFTVQPAPVTKYIGDSHTFTATVTASQGDLSYQWRKDGVDIFGATDSTYLIPRISSSSAGAYSVVATSSLNGVSVSTDSVDTATLKIGLSFETPTVGLTAATSQSFRLPLQATGGSGSKTFELVGSTEFEAAYDLDKTTGLISGVYETATTLAVTVRVKDDGGDSKTVSFNITVVTPVFNKITTVTAKPTLGIRKSIDVSWNRADSTTADLVYIVTLYNAAGDTPLKTVIAYENVTGTSKTITDALYPELADATTYKVSVKVAGTATIGTSEESDLVSVTTIAGPAVPSINIQPSDITPVYGKSGTLSVKAQVSNNGPLTYQWYKGSNPIPGAISDSYTISTITPDDAGSYRVLVTNTVNGASLSIFSKSASIIPTTELSIITPRAGLNAPSGKSYRLMIESSGGTDPKNYVVTNGVLPLGLSLDASTGLISGKADTQTVNTTFALAVTVTDANGSKDTTEIFNIGVYGTQLDSPTVNTTASTNALKTFNVDWSTVDNATSYSVFVYTTETGTVALNSNGLQGLPAKFPFAVNSNNLNGIQDGTTYWVSVVANFDSATAATKYATSPESVRKSVTTCTVSACTNNGNNSGGGSGGSGGGGAPAPSTTPTNQAGSPLTIVPGQPFNTRVPVPGANNFVIQSGSLPAGLSINPITGVISGTPTQSGPYSFSILATPPFPGVVVTYSGNIAPATPAAPPAITAPTLNFVPGAPFRYTPSVPGANNFQIQSGSLPAGLTLNPTTGVISGTPTQSGPYSFSIVATPPAAGQVINFSGVIPSGTSGSTSGSSAVVDLGLKSLDPIVPIVAVKPQANSNLFVTSSGPVGNPTILPNKTLNGLVVTTQDVSVNVAGIASNGAPLPLSSDRQIVVSAGLQFNSSGNGYAPNSEVRVYMFSEPKLLGTVTTDASGNWTANFPIPSDIEVGDHILQVNGYLKSSDVKSVSVGVSVADPTTLNKLTKLSEQVIPFKANSHSVNASGIELLKKLYLEPGTQVTILGYTKKSKSNTDLAVSLDRAIEVKKALLKLNPYLKITIAGKGSKVNKKCAFYKNLCVVVSVKK